MGTRLDPGEVRVRMRTAFADPSASGNTEVVPAPGAGKKIVVYGYQINNNAGTGNNLRFQSAGTNIGALKGLGANGGSNMQPSDVPLFETAENQALNINLSAATAAGVEVQYTIEAV